MTTLSIVFAGPPEQRQTLKITAMQPLSAVLPGVCSKFKPLVDPASVKLTLNKKPVDLEVPFRLANIPAGSILNISSYRVVPTAAPTSAAPAPTPEPPASTEPVSVTSTSSAAPPVAPLTCTAPPIRPGGPPPQMPSQRAAWEAQQAAVSVQASSPSTTQPASSEPAAALTCTAPPTQPEGPAPQIPSQPMANEQATPTPQAVAGTGSGEAATQTPAGGAFSALAAEVGGTDASSSSPTLTASAAAPIAPVSSSSQPVAAAAGYSAMDTDATEGEATTANPGGGNLDLTAMSKVVGWVPERPALLTTEAALQQQQQEQQAAAAAQAGPMDVDTAGGVEDDDSFYELTPEDLAGIIKSAEAKKKEEAQGLKTAAMREAEERAKMQALGPVALRLLFPDGVVLQAAFHAADRLQVVMDVIRSVLIDPTTPVTLFITPPKQVLKDLSVTLYKSGLVPAALVHVQLPQASGPTLNVMRPEVAALLHSALPVDQLLPGQHSKLTKAQEEEEAAKEARRESKRAAMTAAIMGTGAAAGGSGVGRTGGGSASAAAAGDGGSGAPSGPGGPSNYAFGTGKLPKWMQPRK